MSLYRVPFVIETPTESERQLAAQAARQISACSDGGPCPLTLSQDRNEQVTVDLPPAALSAIAAVLEAINTEKPVTLIPPSSTTPERTRTVSPWASPLTSFLEMARGEPRLAQTAEHIRERLLRDVKEAGA